MNCGIGMMGLKARKPIYGATQIGSLYRVLEKYLEPNLRGFGNL